MTPEETHLRVEALLMDARNFPTRAHNLRLPWEEGFAGAVLTGAAPAGPSSFGAWVGPVPLALPAPVGASSSASAGKRLADGDGAVASGLLPGRTEKMRKLGKSFKEEPDEGVRRKGAVEAWVSIALDGSEGSVVGRQLSKLGDREAQVTEMSFVLEEKATNNL